MGIRIQDPIRESTEEPDGSSTAFARRTVKDPLLVGSATELARSAQSTFTERNLAARGSISVNLREKWLARTMLCLLSAARNRARLEAFWKLKNEFCIYGRVETPALATGYSELATVQQSMSIDIADCWVSLVASYAELAEVAENYGDDPAPFHWAGTCASRQVDDLRDAEASGKPGLAYILSDPRIILAEVEAAKIQLWRRVNAEIRGEPFDQLMDRLNKLALALSDRPLKKKRRGRGRPNNSDVDFDRRIYEAKRTGLYKTLDELRRAKGLDSVEEVRRALDRHRKRKARRKNS